MILIDAKEVSDSILYFPNTHGLRLKISREKNSRKTKQNKKIVGEIAVPEK